MKPKSKPTLPEGTDPVAALRQLQQQLAEARYTPLGRGGYWDDQRARDDYAGTTLEAQGWLSPSQAAELRATAHRLTVEAFARPQLGREQERNLIHGGHPDAKPHPRIAYPPLNTEWRHGFPPRGTSTTWRCQRCGTNHEGNPPRCLHCGHTVLDPGHWVAVPGGTG